MGRLNKLLDSVSRLATYFPLHKHLTMPFQRPSLTAQESAEQLDLTVGVFDTSSSRFIYETTCKSQVVPAPLLVLTMIRC